MDGIFEHRHNFRKQNSRALPRGRHHRLLRGTVSKERLLGLVETCLEGGEGAVLHSGHLLGLGKGRLGRLCLLLQLRQAVALRSLLQGRLLHLGVSIGNGSLLGL